MVMALVVRRLISFSQRLIDYGCALCLQWLHIALVKRVNKRICDDSRHQQGQQEDDRATHHRRIGMQFEEVGGVFSRHSRDPTVCLVLRACIPVVYLCSRLMLSRMKAPWQWLARSSILAHYEILVCRRSYRLRLVRGAKRCSEAQP